jgi:hypothetical protein
MSSLWMHLPGVLVQQLKHPAQGFMVFFLNDTGATSAPASRIPSTREFSIIPVLLWPSPLGLEFRAITFMGISFHFGLTKHQIFFWFHDDTILTKGEKYGDKKAMKRRK